MLGRYWRKRQVSKSSREEFVQAVRGLRRVFVYGTRLWALKKAETLQDPQQPSRDKSKGSLVSSDIISPLGEGPIKVDWRLRVTDNGAYKINDVVIEGISMAVTQRSEFASVIQHNGGQVQGLITMLRQRIAGAGLSLSSQARVSGLYLMRCGWSASAPRRRRRSAS